MQVSDKGLMAIIGHEGIVQSRYKDAVGVWTIGVGHTKAAGGIDPANFAGTMTVRETFDLLKHDAAKYAADVSKAVKVALEQYEFDALVSWHYNTGRIRKNPAWLAALNRGDKKTAGRALANSIVTAKGKRLPALVTRRKAESDLFLYGKYPPPFANLYPASPAGKVIWDHGKRIDLVRSLQIGEKPPAKPAGAQEPPKAPIQPKAPQPAPATPAGAKAAKTGMFVSVIAGLSAMIYAGACHLPGWFINLLGYAAKCGGN